MASLDSREIAAQRRILAGVVEPGDQPEAIHPGPLSTRFAGALRPALGRNPKRSAPRPPPPIASLRIFSTVEASIRIIAAQKAALGDVFDPNSACVQRRHASGRARAIGGPGGPPAAIGAGRAGRGAELEQLVDQLAGELAQGMTAKPAKLQTSAEIARVSSRLARAFQHRPSNTPAQALGQWPKTAIPAPPGRQLLDPLQLELDQVAAGRDRAPKLSPRTPSRTLQIAISGLYFIRSPPQAVRSRSRGLRLFPCSHAPGGWKRPR